LALEDEPPLYETSAIKVQHPLKENIEFRDGLVVKFFNLSR
jgi:hypothetical protein